MTMTLNDAIASLLKELSRPPQLNNLGALAHAHSCALIVAEACADGEGGAAAAPARRLALVLTAALERVILDEAAHPAALAELLPQLVAALDATLTHGAADADLLLNATRDAIGGDYRLPELVPIAPPPAKPAAVPARTQTGPTEATPAPVAAASRPPDAEPAYVSEPLLLDLSEREHLEGFLDESAEHMDAIEVGLLAVEADPTDTDKINELFRPFHTIKGIAGFLNLRDVNRLTHEIETILDLGRKNELRITTSTVDLILAGVDVLKSQLTAIRQYLAAPTGGPCPQPEVATIIGQLRRATRPAAKDNVTPAQRPPLGQVLVSAGIADVEEVHAALETQAKAPPPQPKLGEVLVAQGVASATQVEQAVAQQNAAADTSIRVDTRKLDLLVDAVGELVIAQSMVSLTGDAANDERRQRNLSQVTKIVRDVQEIAMAMRMVPIGPTFQKMRRVVRDVARKAGKQVELEVAGEDTELDKNVIQQISDPLVHMVRNAVDHGIEPPAARRAAGKPEAGRVLLNAYHQGDSIVIEVRDDGRGLDRERLLAKARERGLIAPDAQLTDQQAYALILAPGFSTAEQVTDISGRGVGMDVVKRNVEQLRGKIEIQSELGRGSTFLIRLPLTLAIIDGMLVRVGRERMIIPTILIEQSLRPEPSQITTVQQRGALLRVRGELCPLIQLGALFGSGEPIDPCANLVVIVQCEGQKLALVVDELIGQQQVVIKSLGQRFKQVLGVSGAAILGDGRVGVILEPSGILKLYNLSRQGGFSPAPDTTPRNVHAADEAPPESSSPELSAHGAAEPAMAPA